MGIGLTRDGESWAVKVNLAAPLASRHPMPPAVDGVPLRFEVVGAIRAPLDPR